MWLSRQQKQENKERAAESGLVTISGDTVAVELDSERRGLKVYAPGGYRWRPAAGERVLVVQTGEGLCVIGTPCASGLEEGEVGLDAPGGAAVMLKRDGRIVLAGDVELDGTLSLQGETLDGMIRRIAAEVAGAMPG